MAGPAKTPGRLTRSGLESNIRIWMGTVAEYEEAIVRLHGTAEIEWMPLLNDRLQRKKTHLKVLEAQYMTGVGSHHTERLSGDPCVLIISITDLVQVVSAEVDAWKAPIALALTLRQLEAKSGRMKLKLPEKENLHKQRTQAGFNKSVEAAEDDSGIQELKNNIEDYEYEIREQRNEYNQLLGGAYKVMTAANRAAKSNLEIPGIGRWTPIPAPVKATAAPTTATTVTTAPITVTVAQVKVTDIPSDVKAAVNDIQVSTTSDVVATVPRSMTAIIKVDEKLSNITMCPPLRQYTDVKRVERHQFGIGDIGWFPVLRPSLSESLSDIHTEFGYICAKSYPLVIVGKLDDCMLGLIISTSNGNGLSLKGSSVRSRSVPIVTDLSHISTSSDWGQALYPRQKLRVKGSSDYTPPVGAYVDTLNAIMIPYDSRFQKKGNIVGDNVLLLQQMRLSAVLKTSEAGTLGGSDKFWS